MASASGASRRPKCSTSGRTARPACHCGQVSYPKRRAYLTMRNRLITVFIHYRWRTLLVLLPVLLMYELASFVHSQPGWMDTSVEPGLVVAVSKPGNTRRQPAGGASK